MLVVVPLISPFWSRPGPVLHALEQPVGHDLHLMAQVDDESVGDRLHGDPPALVPGLQPAQR